MLCNSFKIYDKKRFEIYTEDVSCNIGEAIVKVSKACICKADLRYYTGNRERKILDLKYPMNLLHEAVGIITKDPSNTFKIGEKVVLVPNLILEKCNKCKIKVCKNKNLGENYCPNTKFASSNYDGFSREYISYPIRNIVSINNLNENASVFIELISVAIAAIRRVDLERKQIISVWGDGILGYILCCVLKYKFNFTIVAIGKHENKLKQFPADKKMILEKLENDMDFDVAFECIGGNGMETGIERIIDKINIGGKIILTGVADKSISINTRKVLEKGLSIYGSTRSSVEDFKEAVQLMENLDFQKKIEELILDILKIYTISDFYNAFEKELKNKVLGKNILEFKF